MLKIGVISSISGIEELCRGAAAEPDWEFHFQVGYLSLALEIAQDMQNNTGVDAFITVGIPPETFDKSVTVPVFPIYPGTFDILDALYKASAYGNKLAFAEIQLKKSYFDLERIAAITGFDIRRYRFTTRQLIRSVVDEAVQDGCDAIVTMGGFSYDYACEIRFPAVLVTPEIRSFQMAQDTMRRFFLAQRVEKEKYRWLNAVMNHSQEGILVLDHDEKIIVINAAMQNFVNLSRDMVVGKSVAQVCEGNPLFSLFVRTPGSYETVKSEAGDFVVKKENLYEEDIPLGMQISVRPVRDIQRMEMDARRKIYEQGFVAKHRFADIMGNSAPFAAVKQKAKGYAESRSNVLLYGQSGSGKEIFAQSIHNASPNADGPFVAVNCAVLTESLLESELFGYEDGAFTGARKGGKAGLFEIAHQGTLFLDEIGDMPQNTQVKMLRVLQERTVRRIGGQKNIPIDVRFVFATNKDLLQLVNEGGFRRDLYYRVNVLPLRIPPLCEHIEDIKDIACNAVRELSARHGKVFSLSDAGIQVLSEYDWPGNIRELYNFLERAVVLDARSDRILREMLEELTASHMIYAKDDPGSGPNALSLPVDTLHNMENAIIKALYRRYAGDKKKVHQVLDISASSLYRRLKEIDSGQFHDKP